MFNKFRSVCVYWYIRLGSGFDYGATYRELTQVQVELPGLERGESEKYAELQ